MKKLVFLLVVLVCLSGVSFGAEAATAVSPSAANLVENGDFEEWVGGKPKGWSLYDNVSAERVYQKETEDVFSGKAAVSAHLGGKLPRGVFAGVVRGVKGLKKGEEVTVSVYVKGIPAKKEFALLAIHKVVGRGYKRVESAQEEFTGEWQKLQIDFVKDWAGEVIIYAGGTICRSGVLIDKCVCVRKE